MELSSEMIKNLSMDQLELLKELGELAKKEADYTKIIENNRRMSEKVGLARDREDSKCIAEDHEFDNLISVQAIYDREQIKLKIKSVFQALTDNGLGKLGIVKRQTENYGLQANKPDKDV
ncbi:MAG: hypothetical protein J7K40_10815 [candidate division Zixibacteria bacterium]|nr:hypothetical protein [candidate division Zixibacteria bacterium]